MKKRKTPPIEKFSIAETHRPDWAVSETIEKSNDIIARFLQVRHCGECDEVGARPYRAKTGEAVDLHWLASRALFGWKLKIVLGNYAWRCGECARKLAAATAFKAAVAHSDRIAEMKASQRRQRDHPTTNSQAWKIARILRRKALKETDVFKKAKLFQRFFMWEAKAKKEK